MSPKRGYVFVLWAENFQEAPATIFVTTFRQAGVRVKIVGLGPQPISGYHGLTLTPDLTLDQALALAANTTCLIIPQTASGLPILKNEPRLPKLFELASQNQAKFVIGPLDSLSSEALKLFPKSLVETLLTYPAGEDVMHFAEAVAVAVGG